MSILNVKGKIKNSPKCSILGCMSTPEYNKDTAEFPKVCEYHKEVDMIKINNPVPPEGYRFFISAHGS